MWDMIYLEGVLEEEEKMEDIEPLVKIDEKAIQHFSHEHYLKLHGKDNKIHCDGKSLQSDFVYHEMCAYLPRIKHHPIHRHHLIHQPFPVKSDEHERVFWFLAVESMFFMQWLWPN